MTNRDEINVDLVKLLVTWEDSLPNDLRRSIIRGTRLRGPGTANLRLAYLSVKLLSCRIQLDCNDGRTGDDIDSHYYQQTRRVCEEMVDFVQELDETHLSEFWIPPNAHSLTSATTFLMRTALRSRACGRNPSLALARTVVDRLQIHRRQYGWDMADNCLSNCGDLIEKVEMACNMIDAHPVELDFTFLEEIDFNALHDTFQY